MASHSSPCVREQRDPELAEFQQRRLKSENCIHPINWESLEKTALGLFPTDNLPREIRDSLLWGSGDMQHSLAGDYNLPVHQDDVSSSQSTDSVRYELIPRCSVSDSVFYAMRKENFKESGLLLLPSANSISLTNEDDNISRSIKSRSIENIPVYILEKHADSSNRRITQIPKDEVLHPRYQSSTSLPTNSRLDITETPGDDSETMTESNNEAIPLITAGSFNTLNGSVDLKNLTYERGNEKLAENIPLLKGVIPIPEDLPIGRTKTSGSLKERILDFCGTLCPCCVRTIKK